MFSWSILTVGLFFNFSLGKYYVITTGAKTGAKESSFTKKETEDYGIANKGQFSNGFVQEITDCNGLGGLHFENFGEVRGNVEQKMVDCEDGMKFKDPTENSTKKPKKPKNPTTEPTDEQTTSSALSEENTPPDTDSEGNVAATTTTTTTTTPLPSCKNYCGKQPPNADCSCDKVTCDIKKENCCDDYEEACLSNSVPPGRKTEDFKPVFHCKTSNATSTHWIKEDDGTYNGRYKITCPNKKGKTKTVEIECKDAEVTRPVTILGKVYCCPECPDYEKRVERQRERENSCQRDVLMTQCKTKDDCKVNCSGAKKAINIRALDETTLMTPKGRVGDKCDVDCGDLVFTTECKKTSET